MSKNGSNDSKSTPVIVPVILASQAGQKSTPAQPPTHTDDPEYFEDVSLWHFAMMNDQVRNSGYDQALGTAIQAKNHGTVLDIGTGSGLLALMAARHGARQVTTCELIPVIAETAKKIIEQNGHADRIRVIRGLSTNLVVGKDVPERFDILVTEIFDDGLLGERAFQAIKHAKEHLLKTDAQIIPARVRVMAMVIESKEIFENYRVGQVSGFDVRPFNKFSPWEYIGIHLDKMAYRPLSQPVRIFDFDFKNLPNGEESHKVDFEITTPGEMHAIAYWYELYLDEKTMVSTGPGLAKLSSWKQAVQIAENAETFQKGEKVTLSAHHDEIAIWFAR